MWVLPRRQGVLLKDDKEGVKGTCLYSRWVAELAESLDDDLKERKTKDREAFREAFVIPRLKIMEVCSKEDSGMRFGETLRGTGEDFVVGS